VASQGQTTSGKLLQEVTSRFCAELEEGSA